MSIGRMSEIKNQDRYFYIEADGYENRCLRGVVYHRGEAPGIQFSSLLEMACCMNSIFDEMGYAKQSTAIRSFENRDSEEMRRKESAEYRKGTMASFRILVKYRCHASWQGELFWQEEKEGFGSFLELTELLDRILTGSEKGTEDEKPVRICQVAVDSCREMYLKGRVQNAAENYLENFEGTAGLAMAMKKALETGGQNPQLTGTGKRNKTVSRERWETYRKGGEKATFLVKVLFREHDSWQGIVYWRERKEERRFRSFMELVMLFASASEDSEDQDDNIYRIAVYEGQCRMEG